LPYIKKIGREKIIDKRKTNGIITIKNQYWRRKDMIKLKNLKTLREKANLSQTELAAKLGVDARTIRRWEDGKNIPHRVYLKMLNRIFGQLD